VVVNVGKKDGLKSGDLLSVERVTREIKDPSTGAVIRRMTSQVGTIQITDVDEGSAEAKIISGTSFKVGDMVKTVTQ
jgi:hypothetical protein